MATIGHLFAKKHTQECSLTDAILSDNTYLIMTRKNIVEVLQDNLISISLANAVRFKNLLTDIGVTSTAKLQTSGCPRASQLCFQGMKSIYSITSLTATRLRLPAHPLKFSSISIAPLSKESGISFEPFVSFF